PHSRRAIRQAEHPGQPHRAHHVHHAARRRERARLRKRDQRYAAQDGESRSAVPGDEHVARLAAESRRSTQPVLHAEVRTADAAAAGYSEGRAARGTADANHAAAAVERADAAARAGAEAAMSVV